MSDDLGSGNLSGHCGVDSLQGPGAAPLNHDIRCTSPAPALTSTVQIWRRRVEQPFSRHRKRGHHPRGSMSAEKLKREKEEDEGIRGKRVKREDSDDEEPLKAKGKAKATVSSCVLVTGTDYKDVEQREKLKSLGAAWCKPLNGWVLPESARGAVEKVINGGELSAAEVASAGGASVDKEPEPSQNAGATVCVAPHKKVIHTTSRRLRHYLTLSDANALAPAGLLYPILRSL